MTTSNNDKEASGAPHSDVLYDSFGDTIKGHERGPNTDEFVVASMTRALEVSHASSADYGDEHTQADRAAHILLVADAHEGRNAERTGREAMNAALDGLLNTVSWSPDLDVASEAELRRELKNILTQCEARVDALARTHPRPARQATSMTIAFVRWPLAFVVHAGDTRAYHISAPHTERGARIKQITTDHTLAQQLIATGELDPAGRENSRFARSLWNAIGGASHVEPELEILKLEDGDALLLCTKGVSKRVAPPRLLEACRYAATSSAAVQRILGMVAATDDHEDATAGLLRVHLATPIAQARAAHHAPKASSVQRAAPGSAPLAGGGEPGRSTPPPGLSRLAGLAAR